jgi:hypothetical protein
MTEEGLFSNADDLDSENQGRDDLGEKGVKKILHAINFYNK